MGQAPKEAERTVATKFFCFKWKTVATGRGRTVSWMELVGKRGHGAVENYLENCVHTEVDVEALERLMEPENEEVSLRYILDERRQQYFLLLTQQRGMTFPSQAEDDGRKVRKGRQHSEKVGKTSGMILGVREQWRKPFRAQRGP